MARIDHNQRDSEYQLMMAIAHLMQVPQTEFDLLFNEYVALEPPHLEVDRITLFHELCMVASIDMEVNPKEVIYLKEMGLRLGLSSGAVDAVIDEMKMNQGKVLSPERLLAIFKAHHN